MEYPIFVLFKSIAKPQTIRGAIIFFVLYENRPAALERSLGDAGVEVSGNLACNEIDHGFRASGYGINFGADIGGKAVKIAALDHFDDRAGNTLAGFAGHLGNIVDTVIRSRAR